VSTLGALLSHGGCGNAAKEKEPLVFRADIAGGAGSHSQLISTEAVVFPVQQAVITPNTLSPIANSSCRRGSRVARARCSPFWKTRILARRPTEQGEFEQAEAGYATTVGAGLPEQMQKAELDTAHQRRL